MWQTKYASAVTKNLGVGVNFGRAVKAISSLGVRSPCEKPKKLEKTSLNVRFFDWDYLHLTALMKETYFMKGKKARGQKRVSS